MPRLVSSSRLFTGKVFDVDRDMLRFEDGRETAVDVVRHRASVVLVPVTDEGTIVLVRQYRHAVGRWLWELPAGTSDPGEDVETAAVRECHEEIGLRPGRLTRLGTLLPTPGYCDEEMVFFLAEGLFEPTEAAALDEDEQLEPKAFTLGELDAMATSGDLEDMKTVCGLQLLRAHRSL